MFLFQQLCSTVRDLRSALSPTPIGTFSHKISCMPQKLRLALLISIPILNILNSARRRYAKGLPPNNNTITGPTSSLYFFSLQIFSNNLAAQILPPRVRGGDGGWGGRRGRGCEGSAQMKRSGCRREASLGSTFRQWRHRWVFILARSYSSVCDSPVSSSTTPAIREIIPTTKQCV